MYKRSKEVDTLLKITGRTGSGRFFKPHISLKG